MQAPPLHPHWLSLLLTGTPQPGLGPQLGGGASETSWDPDLAPPKPKPAKPIIILKDVRLFLNTVTRGLTMMQSAGVQADCQRQDTDSEILLTIRIPR